MGKAAVTKSDRDKLCQASTIQAKKRLDIVEYMFHTETPCQILNF